MNAQDLKEYILNNDEIETILDALGCGHIKDKGDYISASNPDGDNPQAIILYKNENLTCLDYTRQLTKSIKTTDIFDLVAFFEECTFPEALKFCCETLGLDYYSEPEDVPESLQILKMLKQMQVDDSDYEDTPLKPISEKILNYYLPYGNKKFEDDGISLAIQKEFEIGYDPLTDRITIPIRDDLGTLVGVKGRLYGEPDEYHPKYLFIEKCAKGRLLYSYWQNKEYIKHNKYLYITEAEKGALQLVTMGFRNSVAIGSKTVSRTQIELITRTGCTPVFCFDADVDIEELKHIANEFIEGVDVYALIDEDGILDEKESPTDNPEKWEHMYKNNMVKLR